MGQCLFRKAVGFFFNKKKFQNSDPEGVGVLNKKKYFFFWFVGEGQKKWKKRN